jgi:hypothetical protein
VSVDGPIEVRFDRYLLPKTAVRQSILVYSGDRGNSVLLEPTYDVLERVVTYRPGFGARLTPGIVYEVALTLPDEDPNGYGFRAFDGAPLVRGDVPLHFSFRTARSAPPAPADAPLPGCADALAVLSATGCGSLGCHTSDGHGPMGLALDSASALRDTAIRRVAHETDSGPYTGRPLVDPPRFGLDMSIIDPGSSETSYLVYKLLVNPENFGGRCETRHAVELPPGTCPLASDAERARLHDAFVALDPMPPGGAGIAQRLDGLRTLLGFIDAGATTAGCP